MAASCAVCLRAVAHCASLSSLDSRASTRLGSSSSSSRCPLDFQSWIFLKSLHVRHHSVGQFGLDVRELAGFGWAGDIGAGHVGGELPGGLEVGEKAYSRHLLRLGVGWLGLAG